MSKREPSAETSAKNAEQPLTPSSTSTSDATQSVHSRFAVLGFKEEPDDSRIGIIGGVRRPKP